MEYIQENEDIILSLKEENGKYKLNVFTLFAEVDDKFDSKEGAREYAKFLMEDIGEKLYERMETRH